jgi:hypothetical protein
LITVGWLKSPKLLERAENAARQMRYFRLFSQKGSFGELRGSAERAGFILTYEEAFDKQAGFWWAADGDHPDFAFHASFENPASVSVTAESYGDIFGLVMTSIASVPSIGVEVKSTLEKHEFGRNALPFRKILLTFPDFDGGPTTCYGD